jgi:hypothetical protein
MRHRSRCFAIAEAEKSALRYVLGVISSLAVRRNASICLIVCEANDTGRPVQLLLPIAV